jgi:hypothetical protein
MRSAANIHQQQLSPCEAVKISVLVAPLLRNGWSSSVLWHTTASIPFKFNPLFKPVLIDPSGALQARLAMYGGWMRIQHCSPAPPLIWFFLPAARWHVSHVSRVQRPRC